jgi:hypothetical protein
MSVRPSRRARSITVPGTIERRFASAWSMTRTSIGTPPQRTSQSDRLLDWIIDCWLDHQNIDIGACPVLSAGAGAKENNARPRRRGVSETTTDLGDESVL